MAGESILIVEDSSAERDYAKAALEDAGYRTITAANAAAALTYPEARDVSVIVMDSELEGVTGFETTRMLRQQNTTHPIPILLLIPDATRNGREDVSPRGANGYLLKPYDSQSLIRKVNRLIEEKNLDEIARKYLENAADEFMGRLADEHIKGAVERKTLIIIERCIQNVATEVDKRAKAQVEESVTALTAEKEQELVKFTVREVAQSMVEKLAERKVTEAMDAILNDNAEKTVKKIADQILPASIRERIKDALTNTLPREIQVRVQKQVEKEGPEIGKQIVGTLEDASKTVVPRIAREIMPDIVDKKFKEVAATQIPRIVKENVSRELDNQMNQRITPAVKDIGRRLRKTVLVWNAIMGAIIIFTLGFTVWLTMMSGGAK